MFYPLISNYISNGGNILGILHGHQHKDSYYTTGLIEEQTDPFINIIGCDAGHAKTANQLGTKNGYCFSVFTIDTVNSKIYETKVGRGNDREFDFVPAEAIVAQWNK